MQRAVLSLATQDRNYPRGLARLIESVQASDFGGEMLAWPPGDFPAGCPPHLEVPFAFKPYCFHEARQRGREVLLWLDSACVVLRGLDELFRQIEARGYLLFRNQQFVVGEWASDAALARLGLSREAALRLPEVNGAALGLNLRHAVGRAFFDQWFAEAQHGAAFRGAPDAQATWADYRQIKHNIAGRASRDARVRGHRHDQTVAGILAHRLGLELTASGLETAGFAWKRLHPGTMIMLDRRVGRSRCRVVPLGRIRAEAAGAPWARAVRYLSRGRL